MNTYRLEIRLFGAMEIYVEGRRIDPIRLRKAKWLLALLALRAGQEVDRQWLAEKLWPDQLEQKARANLRQCLSTDLRPFLGMAAALLLNPTPNSLCLDQNGLFVDVIAFDKAIGGQSVEEWEHAVDLRRRPLLEDYIGLEDWVTTERAMREVAYQAVLERLAKAALDRGVPADAVRYMRLLVAAEPLEESAYHGLMRALAARGDQAEITRVYRDLRVKLHQELNIAPSTETTTLYRNLISRSQAPVLPASVQKTAGAPCRLPIPLTELIGREENIQEVVDSLRSSRLVTLTGAGGIGKTRLSIAVAEALLSEYKDGVWFVELAPLMDPGLVPQTIAKTLGLREETGLSIGEMLLQALACRSLLLILDNCEHLLEEAARLANTILRACAEVRIVATSQHELGVTGEIVYRVPTLTSPDPPALPLTKPRQLATLAEYDAVNLFGQRACLQRPGFVLTYDNALAVVKICSCLDGIPLAIELAAACMKALTAEEIAERLHDRFRLLTRGSRTSLPRHQTLRATMDWSHELLEDQSKKMLRRLSVFSGGWQLEAAEQVCVGQGIEGWEVWSLLTSLVEKSLVICEEQGEQSRYNLLETIRQYSSEKLEGSEEADLVRQRHQQFYLALVDAVEPHLSGIEQGEWLQRLEAEHENLRVALRCSLSETGPTSLQLCGLLCAFWWRRGHFWEGRQWCAQILEKTDSQNQTWERMKVLYGIGILAFNQGDYASARAYLEESLSIGQIIGDKKGTASALSHLGAVASEQGDYVLACACHERSLSLRREIEDEVGIATSLGNLGLVAQYRADYVSASAYHKESLSITRKRGEKQSIASTLNNLGLIALYQADYASACVYHEESLSISKELGDKRGIATSLMSLGNVAQAQTDYSSACVYFEESLLIGKEIGDKKGIASTLSNLGLIAMEQGDYVSARAYNEENLSIMREIGVQKGVANSLCNLGVLAYYQADYVSARFYYEQSLDLYEKIGDQFGLAIVYCNLGLAVKNLNDYLSANAYCKKSLYLFSKVNDPRCIASSLESIAGLMIVQQQMERAAHLWGAAEVLREEIDAPLTPNEQKECNNDVAIARDAMGMEALSVAWKYGRSMTMEQVIEYALEEFAT